MRRDHEAGLNAALDQLYLQGSAAILWEHLYLWYNAHRLSKGVFSDIIERWQALCEGYGYSEDEIPELEEIQSSDTWLLLCRGLFKGEEQRTPLADRT
jgi:hypothetical protein